MNNNCCVIWPAIIYKDTFYIIQPAYKVSFEYTTDKRILASKTLRLPVKLHVRHLVLQHIKPKITKDIKVITHNMNVGVCCSKMLRNNYTPPPPPPFPSSAWGSRCTLAKVPHHLIRKNPYLVRNNPCAHCYEQIME